VAAHLLKWCHHWEDREGFRVGLYYLRDLEKREVDFLVLWEDRPWLLVECTINNDRSMTSLKYYKQKLDVSQSFLVTLEGKAEFEDHRTGIRVIPAERFLMGLV
jgi:predicted AAA+ superfamily ATPase